MIGPTVHIYRNRRSGELKIQPCARHGGVPQAFGAPSVLPSSVSPETLLTVVLQNLAKTEQQRYDLALAPRFSKEEQDRIIRDEQLITIHENPTDFELVPSRKMRNSFGSIDNERLVIDRAEFLKSGGDAVLGLFERVSSMS